jgi:Glycosyl transferase family 2
MNNETMNNELVSIIITNYNYERYLAASIASALAVDWSRTEIIVVDDGSTDRSRDIVDSFVPMGIKSLTLKTRDRLWLPPAALPKVAASGLFFWTLMTFLSRLLYARPSKSCDPDGQ